MTKLERIAKDLMQEDEAKFLQKWVKNPMQLGAIMPSSPYLAKKMAQQLDLSLNGPVIELGPGTGPITESLIAHGVAENRLVLVEFEPSFVKMLRERFPLALVIEGDAYNLKQTLTSVLSEKAAAIVSGLPLQTKSEKERVMLLNDGFELMQPNAPFIQFTYAPLSPLPSSKDYTTKGSDPVWRNMPPARVFTYIRKV